MGTNARSSLGVLIFWIPAVLLYSSAFLSEGAAARASLSVVALTTLGLLLIWLNSAKSSAVIARYSIPTNSILRKLERHLRFICGALSLICFALFLSHISKVAVLPVFPSAVLGVFGFIPILLCRYMLFR